MVDNKPIMIDGVDVSAVHRGIDWEHNQFRIEPAYELLKLSEAENE